MIRTTDDVAAIQQALRCGSSGCRCLANSNARYHCPAHDGESASLSVTTKDGRILVNCFSGCDGDAVVAALKEMNLWPAAEAKANRNVQVAEYDYLSPAGSVIFQVVKFDNPKSFKQRQPDGKGGHQWNLNGVTRVPYQLPELINADPSVVVYITEGEKDVDRLRSLRLVATCNPGGAGKWLKPYSENFLRNRHVVVLPDNDEAGLNHAEKVAKFTNGIAASLKVVELPDLPLRGDVSDWIDGGHTVDELLALVEVAPPWKPSEQEPTEILIPSDAKFTDLGNAERLVELIDGNARYCHQWSKWVIWDGRRWSEDNDGQIYRLAIDTVKQMYKKAAEMAEKASEIADSDERQKAIARSEALTQWGRKCESRNRLEAMVSIAKNLPGVPVSPNDFDADAWLLNFTNGTLNLKGGELRGHSRENMITIVLPYGYDAGAMHPLWNRFLNDALPDLETQEFSQRVAGATIVGEAKDDVIIVNYGVGGTGKTTYLKSLQNSLGEYASSVELGTFTTARDAHSPQPDVVRLKGKRMVSISEVDPNQGGQVAMLKRATGAEDISTRTHHGATFQFTPQFTMHISTNDRPRVPDNDTGLWRRIREIPFTVKFTNPDTSIRETLTNPMIAGPAIMAWAVKGCLEWQKRGLNDIPQQVKDATASYRTEMDPIADWLEECTLEQAGLWTEFKTVFKSYQQWAADYKTKPLGRNQFRDRLAERYTIEAHGKARNKSIYGLTIIGDFGAQADFTPEADFSKSPPTPSTVGYSQEPLSHEENLETKSSKSPPQAQSTPDTKSPLSHEKSVNEKSAICTVCGGEVERDSVVYLPDGGVRHRECNQ